MITRLNKLLAERGIASRREADRLITAGDVLVNGKVVTELGTKVDPDVDKVTLRTNPALADERKVYVALNKPSGYVSTVKATRQDPHIVLDLVPGIKERIYPVGRLDKETTGLLILTNDGTLTFRLTHPSSQCEKEYEATLVSPISDAALEKLRNGVTLWGEKTLPTEVRKISTRVIRIILREGKNRQIRRICEKVGYPVKELKRVRIKSLTLGKMQPGQWRFLNAQEVAMLKE